MDSAIHPNAGALVAKIGKTRREARLGWESQELCRGLV